ncbi:MAG: hypothetical protein IT372_01560 [Polyangiaceae bacterium]|nr:hypothetical protein [Polyangiaceae bacterium]
MGDSPDNPEPPEARFRAAFARWSGRVRRRLALRIVLTGAAAGLALGAVGAGAAWKLRRGEMRPWAATAGLLGAAAGIAVARRRRWPDSSVALYLDGKLGSDETIATAVELDRGEGSEPARAVVLSQAARALDGATSKAVRARVLHPWHAALPIAAAAIGYLSWIPLPPAPAGPTAPPGVEQVKIADLAGIEKIIKLAEVSARDDAQRERLKRLAEDAKKLREKLRNGMEKREAQADIARLRDAITAERLSLGDGQERQGMESALGKLGENPDMKGAQKALGDRDLVELDEEMERLANKLEKEDREQAKKTLEEAAEAAKKAGAPNVAKALEEQKKRLEELGKKTEKLKELAKALGDGLGEEGKQALGDLGKTGSGEDAQKLAESMEKALEGLSEAERKQLAENLKRQAEKALPEGSAGEGPSKEQLKELAEQLGSPEGQKQLEEQLKEMAKAPAEGSEEGERQKALGDAEGGAGEAEGELGGRPMPVPVAGKGNGSGDGSNGTGGQKGGAGKGGKGGKDEGQATPGHSEGGGPGDHQGQTAPVAGGDMKSRASAKINRGAPMPGMVMGRTAGRPGESANVRGEGALGQVAPDEVGAVERSEVPEEYREQVGRYFQPR